MMKVLFLCLTVAWIFPSFASRVSAESEVAGFTSELVEQILAESKWKDSKQRLYHLFLQKFDVRGISRFAVGRKWRTLSKETRQELTILMGKHLYMGAYLAFIGAVKNIESVEYRVERVAPHGKRYWAVWAVLPRRDGPSQKIRWLLKESDGDLRVFSATIEGIDLVTSFREEITSILRRGGVPKLQAVLRKKYSLDSEI